MHKLTNVLVTGGAGFIVVNFIKFLLGKGDKTPEFNGRIINMDVLTYAGNIASLKEIDEKFGKTRYFFEQGDICDRFIVEKIFRKYDIDTVVHFAAESHVDRSILGPEAFIKTNVLGTFNLLECARNAWKGTHDVLFHHISTDEVYGSLGETGCFTETTNIGGDNEWENIKLLNTLIGIVAKKSGEDAEKLRALITYVKDRPGTMAAML